MSQPKKKQTTSLVKKPKSKKASKSASKVLSKRVRTTRSRADANSGQPSPFGRPLKQRPLENESYYHGLLPRADANALLVKQGDFIVRLTQQSEGAPKELAISLQWDQTKQHIIPATTTKGAFYTDPSIEFPSVGALVKYYYKTKQPLKKGFPFVLMTPISKPIWELNKTEITLEKPALGAGAFGEVYKGTLTPKDTKLAPIPVAVKVCTVGLMTKAALLEFMKEARMMRQYRHPNVVQFYGIVTEDPVMIVMELVSGGSLNKYLQKKSEKTLLLNHCTDVAKGLEYLHSKGCIHRDVAARNCLISGDGVVKISDFGLCRTDQQYRMDPSKKVPIRWLSPETLANGLSTNKSDVFSYGILMWEIYSAGQEPYPGHKVVDVPPLVRNGYRMTPPPLMPDDVRAVLLQCWEEDPEKRPDFATIVRLLQVTQEQLPKIPLVKEDTECAK